MSKSGMQHFVPRDATEAAKLSPPAFLGIIKATRAHYAMTKHRAGPGRIKVHTEVMVYGESRPRHAGVLWIADTSPAVRKRALNRAVTVLGAMFQDLPRYTVRVSVVHEVQP